jgi:hypothetical protein
MDPNMRVTKSRGSGKGRTPRGLRNRPPTPRASGVTTGLRTPSPNKTGRSASRASTATLPTRDEQVNGETPPSQENQPETIAPSIPEAVQPQTDQQEQGNPENDNGQPASNQSRPLTPNWTGFTLPPNFQEARENDRRAHEAGEEPSHPTYSRLWNRTNLVAMEPLGIDHNFYLDYSNPQSIKFLNKEREKLPGEPFSGKNIFSWLKRLEIKANEFRWIPTLTIDRKL